jgi:hypothetical protein
MSSFAATRMVFFGAYVAAFGGPLYVALATARRVAGDGGAYRNIGLLAFVTVLLLSALLSERAAQRNIWSHQPLGAAWIGAIGDAPLFLVGVPVIGRLVRAWYPVDPAAGDNNPFDPPRSP